MTTPEDDDAGQLPAAGPDGGHPWPGIDTGPSWRATVRSGLVTMAAVATAGVPFGLLWMLVAPDVPIVQTRIGPVPADPQPEQFVAADGWFALLGAGLGVLVAVAVWILARRTRGPVLLAGVVLGATAAAVVGWQLGRLPGRGAFERWQATAALGTTGMQPADLRAYGVLLMPAFAAVITYTLLAGWSHDPDLGVADEPDWAAYPFSSGSTGEPAPTAVPGSPGSGAAARPPG